MLEGSQSNYICGIYLDQERAGLCFCDITTGKTHVTAFSGSERVEHVMNELGRFSPVEAVLSECAWGERALVETLREKFRCRAENRGDRPFRLEEAERMAEKQYGREARSAADAPARTAAAGPPWRSWSGPAPTAGSPASPCPAAWR